MKHPIATRIYPLTDDPQPHVARDTLYRIAPGRYAVTYIASDPDEAPYSTMMSEREAAAWLGSQVDELHAPGPTR